MRKYVEDLKIRAINTEQNVQLLSEGNQQKVVFAKSMAAQPKLLLLDDPTVGVDIATKKDIAKIVQDFARQGNGVLFVSSEMEEIAALCDRILVLRKGEIVQEIAQAEEQAISEEALMHAIQR